jgi:hypothetical protein
MGVYFNMILLFNVHEMLLRLSDYLNGLIKYCKCFILSLTILKGCGIFHYDDDVMSYQCREILFIDSRWNIIEI